MSAELHALFRGRVQGVGFRASVARLAEELSLSGTVANLPDGSVELYAEGSKEELLVLLERIQRRFQDMIEETESGFSPSEGRFQCFTILR